MYSSVHCRRQNVSCYSRSSVEQSSIARHCCPALSIFCCRLKSHLFSLSYPAFSLFSHLVVVRSECAALRRGMLCWQNCVLLLCVLTLSANNTEKLACSRALTESALDDILRLFFFALDKCTYWLIDWLIDWLCSARTVTRHFGHYKRYYTYSI